jgi:F-type H+-transporting ATPase subunit epsilon
LIFNSRFCIPTSYNKYTQIASRAARQGLKESERVAAEKRAAVGIKYQIWQNGTGGEQVGFCAGSLVGPVQAGQSKHSLRGFDADTYCLSPVVPA